MSGVNPDTVWTWNAIGKRNGAWNLDKDAPEAKQGFLLNHIIPELLPENKDGYRYANSDPVTGQAAWFDLRVAIEKCPGDELEQSAPQFDALPHRLKDQPIPVVLQFGKDLKNNDSGAGCDSHRKQP